MIDSRYLWSAQRQGCDLYPPRPVRVIVGDKLYEAGRALTKTPAKAQSVVDQLESEVEFPDLRRWVNEGKIEFKEVLKMRKKAKRFRRWLQTEADKDRNAMIFYLQEAAHESGFTRAGRISINGPAFCSDISDCMIPCRTANWANPLISGRENLSALERARLKSV